MANHPSAIKRHKQSLKRRARNKHVRSGMRTLVKEVRAAASSGDKDRANAVLKKAISSIDGAASKGVIHRNTASRNVSRLTRLVSSIG